MWQPLLPWKVNACWERWPALHLALLCFCGNQIWMFHRMKIKPLLPAWFHEVSCLFKRSGLMWLMKARCGSPQYTHFLSSEKLRVTVLLYKQKNWSLVPYETPVIPHLVHNVLSKTLVWNNVLVCIRVYFILFLTKNKIIVEFFYQKINLRQYYSWFQFYIQNRYWNQRWHSTTELQQKLATMLFLSSTVHTLNSLTPQ